MLEEWKGVPDSAEASAIADRAFPLLSRACAEARARRLESTSVGAHPSRTLKGALVDSEVRFARVFEGSPLGIALISPDGTPYHCNPALERMLVRELSRRALVEYGYSVLEAGDAEEALRVAKAQGGPIHLAITDVVMPGTGGAALAVRLLRLRPGLKILYLSGYTDDAMVRQGISQEQVDFLQKPFSSLELAQKVAAVLGR